MEGEAPSLLTFTPVEYLPAGKVAADADLRTKVANAGIRELMRRTGLHQHTIETIRDGKPVRRTTLQRITVAIESREPEGRLRRSRV